MTPSDTSSNSDAPAVVVGVSLTTGSPTALRWAMEAARARHAPLRAVTAWRPPLAPPGPAPRPVAFPPILPTEIQIRTEAALARAVRNAVGDDRCITCTAVRGNTITVLVAASSEAQLLVLGPLQSGLADALLEPRRFIQILHRAACPVVIMPVGRP